VSADAHLPVHGGLTCAALDESVRNCNCVTHIHGRLTPAALANVRLCTVNVVIFQPTGTVQQERLA
jgi:hypothetical protein